MPHLTLCCTTSEIQIHQLMPHPMLLSILPSTTALMQRALGNTYTLTHYTRALAHAYAHAHPCIHTDITDTSHTTDTTDTGHTDKHTRIRQQTPDTEDTEDTRHTDTQASTRQQTHRPAPTHPHTATATNKQSHSHARTCACTHMPFHIRSLARKSCVCLGLPSNRSYSGQEGHSSRMSVFTQHANAHDVLSRPQTISQPNREPCRIPFTLWYNHSAFRVCSYSSLGFRTRKALSGQKRKGQERLLRTYFKTCSRYMYLKGHCHDKDDVALQALTRDI